MREVARTAASPAELPPAQELYEQIATVIGVQAVSSRSTTRARCPYCARVRIVLAEKGIEFETVEIDLSDRPRVAVREEPGRARAGDRGGRLAPLPESAVIMEFLEERYPEPALLPADPADRAPSGC